ncbi:hypothetical protein Btru_008140 [Bulinus truncatus]|nr:hypothetical protein Btru_008140 [Bulinus truncatus]
MVSDPGCSAIWNVSINKTFYIRVLTEAFANPYLYKLREIKTLHLGIKAKKYPLFFIYRVIIYNTFLNMNFKIFILSLIFTIGLSQVEKCPPNLPRDRYLQVHDNFCFRFVIFRVRTHTNAKADCAIDGGTLGLLKTKALNDYVVSEMVNTYRSPVGTMWIGLNDIDQEDTFVWEDGTSLTFSNFATSEGTANNTQGVHQPHPNENCVTIDIGAHGQWRDYPCDRNNLFGVSESHSYLCQYKLSA